MKNSIVLYILIIVLISACQPEMKFDQIKGGWKTRDIINTTGQKVYNLLYFDGKNKVTVQLIQDNVMLHLESGKYEIDSLNKGLILSFSGTVKARFKLVKLSSEKLEMLNLVTGRIDRYQR